MVKLELSKKESIYSVVLILAFVTLGFVFAYGDFSGNDATVNGHSSDEIMVKNSTGGLVSLQGLIDSSGLSTTTSGSFGDWMTKSLTTIYQAEADGFVLAINHGGATWRNIYGYTDSNSSPNTLVAYSGDGYENAAITSITFPVKKGDYWKVTGLGTITVRWLPIN